MRVTDTLLSPNGRITRLGFWGAWLALAFITIVAGFGLAMLADYLVEQIDNPTLAPLADPANRSVGIALILAIPLTWMAFCLLVKRWHDRGRSGWWLLFALIPIIGQLWAIIECGFLAGTRGGNKYGPSPLGGRYDHALHFGDEIPEDMA